MKNNQLNIGMKKVLIPALVIAALAISAFVPLSVAYADDEPPGDGSRLDGRLEKCYAKLQEWYGVQDNNIGRSKNLLNRIEELLVKADELGIDASEVEALLPSMIDALQQAEIAHAEADAILTEHAGFDGNGKVEDRESAIETCRSAHSALSEARESLLQLREIAKAVLDLVREWRASYVDQGVPVGA